MSGPYILTIPLPSSIPTPPNNLHTWPGVSERAAAGLPFAIPANPPAAAVAPTQEMLVPGTIIVPANGTTPATGPPTITISAPAPPAAPAQIIVPIAPPAPPAPVPAAATTLPAWCFSPPAPGFWPAAGLVADASKPAWYVHPDGQDTRDGKRPVVTWKFS